MRTLPMALALEIYDVSWWQRLRLDDVWVLPIPLAERLFDFAINAGRTNAIRSLQQVLNVLNKQQSLWEDLPADGRALGPRTLGALQTYIRLNRNKDAVERITMLMFSMQNYHYVNMSLARPENETFTNGWVS